MEKVEVVYDISLMSGEKRWDVLEAHSRATSLTASGFIDAILRRMPFPIRAIQVGVGAEFQDAFEKECPRRMLEFCLPYTMVGQRVQ